MSLRFRIRHVHKTLADHLENALADLGWVNTPVNFGTTPITFLEFSPDEAGQAIAANTVAITLGDEPSAVDQELGDGLREIAFPVYVDIYGANQSIAASIASDVKHLLEDCYLQVRDYTASAAGAETTERIELDKDDVTVEKPPVGQGTSDFRRFWRVVRTQARVQYIQD